MTLALLFDDGSRDNTESVSALFLVDHVNTEGLLALRAGTGHTLSRRAMVDTWSCRVDAVAVEAEQISRTVFLIDQQPVLAFATIDVQELRGASSCTHESITFEIECSSRLGGGGFASRWRTHNIQVSMRGFLGKKSILKLT